MAHNENSSPDNKVPEVTLGRPTVSSWAEKVLEVISDIQVAGITFEPRERPAVTYLAPSEINDLYPDKDELETIEQINRFATSLARDVGSLTFRSHVEVHTGQIRLKPRHNAAGHLLEIRSGDRRSKKYPGGYLIEGEKVAVRGLFGLEVRRSNTDRAPRHWLRLGSIEGLDESNKSQYKDAVSRVIPRKVVLKPVEPVLL